MHAVIITIGDEILLGQILDTNSRYMARQLGNMGVEVVKMLTVRDDRNEISKAVGEAMSRAELVLVTGGLGPTKDDVTKKVLADYFGMRLVYNEEVMGWLKELLAGRGIAMNENNKSQAWLPENCRILRNFKGQAFSQFRLRNIIHFQHFVSKLQTGIFFLQIRQHIGLHQMLHLKRHTRHRN